MVHDKNLQNLENKLKEVFNFIDKLDSPKFFSLPSEDHNEHFLDYSIYLKKLEESRTKYIKKIKSEISCNKFYSKVSKELLLIERSSNKVIYRKKLLERMIVDLVVEIIVDNNSKMKKDFYHRAANESTASYENRIINKIKKHKLKAIYINHHDGNNHYRDNHIKCYIEIINNKIIPTLIPVDFFPIDSYSLSENKYESSRLGKGSTINQLTIDQLIAITSVICNIGKCLTVEYLHENEICITSMEDLERLKKDKNYANIDINKSIAVCAGFIKGFKKFSKLSPVDNEKKFLTHKTKIISSKLRQLQSKPHEEAPLEMTGSPLFVDYSYHKYINEIHEHIRQNRSFMMNLRGCSDVARSPFIDQERHDQFSAATMSFKQSILDGLDDSQKRLKKRNKLKDFNNLMEAELDNFFNGEILEDLKKGLSLTEINNLNGGEAYLYCKARLDSYPKLEIEKVRKKVTKYFIKNDKGLKYKNTKRRIFSKKLQIYINKNFSKEISIYAMSDALINENHFLYDYEPYNHFYINRLEESIRKYESESASKNKNEDLIENYINELKAWMSLERQLPVHVTALHSFRSRDKSFSNIYGKFMPSDFFKLENIYSYKGKYSNNSIEEAKKHIEQFINFIHINPESASTFNSMFHIARRNYLEKEIKEKNLDMSNAFEEGLLLAEENRFWDLLLEFVHTKASIVSRTFIQDICGSLIRAILFIKGVYAYGEKGGVDTSTNLYSMVIGELDFILPSFDAHIESLSFEIDTKDGSLNIPIGYKFFSWQIREAVLDLRNFISAMEDVNIYDLPEPAYHKSKNFSFEQVLLFSKNKREIYIKNLSDLKNYIDERKKDKNGAGKKDYQRYAQIRNSGLKANSQGKINRKDAKKWLMNRSGIRKLKELFIDNELESLIGYLDYEEISSKK